MKRAGRDGDYGRWTVFVIQGLILLALASSIFEYLVWEREIWLVWQILGFCLIVGKIILKRQCLALLGGFYSLYIEVLPQQKLVTGGPYAVVRHPCFLSSILEVFAICLVANAWLTMLVFGPLITALYNVRARMEERILLSFFGEEYRYYQSKVPALMPCVKCIFSRNRSQQERGALSTTCMTRDDSR
ncbi:MAG: isoprenylcysteine carboxylmethyltransferase family protein [Candidatus Thiodiazotropha sp.]